MSKLEYKKAIDTFYKGGKKLMPETKGFMQDVSNYVIEKVAEGQSLSEITIVDSKVWPTLATILDHIEASSELQEAMTRAEVRRLNVLKEDLLRVSKEYTAMPSPENKDRFTAIEQTYRALSKQAASGGNVVVKLNNWLPKSFWDKRTIITPENPRDVKDNNEQ